MSICILTALQRSGTGALGSLLEKTPDITYFGEVFRPDAYDNKHYYFNYAKNKIKDDPSYALPGSQEIQLKKISDYFDYLQSCNNKQTTLLDIKYNSMHMMDKEWKNLTEEPTMLSYLIKNNIPTINLVRHNLLQIYVSTKLAEINQAWHTKNIQDIKHNTIHIDPEDAYWTIVIYDSEIERMRYFLRLHRNLITLEYSQLFTLSGELSSHASDKLKTILQCDNLENSKPEYIKQTYNELENKITNFSELCMRLRNTKFEWMLHDQG